MNPTAPVAEVVDRPPDVLPPPPRGVRRVWEREGGVTGRSGRASRAEEELLDFFIGVTSPAKGPVALLPARYNRRVSCIYPGMEWESGGTRETPVLP